MLFAFTVLPLVLMVPFVWNNVFHTGNPFELFTNSYFEAVSGFTTTGFSFVADPAALPASLLFYRSLVEFIGGIGFVYILVAFLYPEDSLDDFCDAFGIEYVSGSLKKVFLAIMLVYTLFVAVFTAIFYFTYSTNLVVSSCAAIDVLTGGYQPNITAGIGLFQISILILMLLGSVNFSFHYNLVRLKFREMLTPEIKLYLGVIVVATIIMSFLAWINPFDSLFHVVSMASSTGIEYIGISATPIAAKILFIFIGIVGGCAFSMAGGIRIKRIQQLWNALRRNIDAPSQEELKSIIIFIGSFVGLLFLLSLAFSTVGITFLDSVFEISSALTTNGISMGITTVAMPSVYKWLLIFAMIIGRVEIFNIYKAIRGS